MAYSPPSLAASAEKPALPATGSVERTPSERSPAEKIAPLVLEDVPELLQPKREPSDEERDHLEALSHFSAARMLELDGKHAQALRLYQRAFRYDREAVSIARAIIPLAIRLKRHAEAVRYALLAAELDDADPTVLSRLGVYLAEKGDWGRAATLYEKALAARDGADPTPTDLMLRMQLGRLYHLTGDYEKAADVFTLVFEAMQRPDDFELEGTAKKLLLDDAQVTYRLIGDCFLSAGRVDDAAAAFEKADEAKPDKGLLNYNLARVDFERGKLPSTMRRLKVCFDEGLTSRGMAPYRLLGSVLEKQDKADELVGRLEELRAAQPENVPLAYFLAETYREGEQLDKAETLYRELLEQTPTMTGYRVLIDVFRKRGKLDSLLDVVAEAVEKTAGLEALGDEGRAVFEDIELVEKLLDVARTRLKEDAEAFGYAGRLATALLALQAGKYADAGEMFDRAIEAKPDATAELLLSWGLGLLVAEQYEDAAEVFERGVAEKVLADDNPVFHFYLAGALEMAGHTERALAAARRAVEAKPDSPRFHGRVAWILYHADRNEEAIEAYKRMVDRFEVEYGSSEVRQVLREARLVLSNLCVITDRLEEAESWLEQVLDEFPEDTSALNDLGYLWADADKRLRQAEGMIRKALAAEPDNPAYRDSLGWVLYRLERFDEAVAELEQAAEEEPDPVILDHLGDAYQGAGKPQKALDTWRRALDKFRESDETEDAERLKKKIDKNQ